MFRLKKSFFPARPQPPSWEQMEEDLKSATDSDIIFCLSPNTAGTTHPLEHPNKSGSSVDAENVKDYDNQELFEQAIEFVEKNDDLLNNIKLLSDKREGLKQVSSNLKLTVEEVKKQALVAIDGE
nr:UPF0449 protein C19orf25 homolog [Cherax quadricarinatus]